MTAVLLLALTAVLAPLSTASTFEPRTFQAPDGTSVRYGLALPEGYDRRNPWPLVLALHPAGGGTPYYGDGFLRSIFLPGLRELDAIMIAPDCPGREWTDPAAERAVLALLAAVQREFAVDERRILVVGFSMGGRGTWFFSARHPERFRAAIVMAGRTDEPLDRLARIPTYVIHSRDDEVVPYRQAEERATELRKMQRPVELELLSRVGHYQMGGYVGALERGGRWVAEQWGMKLRR